MPGMRREPPPSAARPAQIGRCRSATKLSNETAGRDMSRPAVSSCHDLETPQVPANFKIGTI